MGAFAFNRMNFSRVNRDYPINTNTEVEIWYQASARLVGYQRYWNFYKGDHWTQVPEAGEPVSTINFVQKFVDKHVQYLVGNQFSVHSNFRGINNEQVEQVLMDNWERNDILATGFEMAQVGGVTGDCWVNVGLDEDPIFGTRVKYTVLPSEVVYPIFSSASNRIPEAILLMWPDNYIVSNQFGRIRYRSVNKGQYWTKDQMWFLENGKVVDGPFPNVLKELPFVHISNLRTGIEFWGRSDMCSTIDLQREMNEKVTDISDIINYHAAPVTIIYGAKASQLQKGAKKVWSGLPTDARVENLELNGDLGAATAYVQNLRQTLFELSSMTSAAFGGDMPISNTSGVALSIQFAPIIEHMKLKRITYGAGIQKLNYLTLRFLEILGTYKAKGSPMPYYSFVKWPDPMPRDKMIELQALQQMQQMQLLTRVQILRQCIQNDIAPEDLEAAGAANIVDEAMQEELYWIQASTDAGAGTQVQEGGDEGMMNADAAAEQASVASEKKGGRTPA